MNKFSWWVPGWVRSTTEKSNWYLVVFIYLTPILMEEGEEGAWTNKLLYFLEGGFINISKLPGSQRFQAVSKDLPGFGGLFQKVMEFRKKGLRNLRYVAKLEKTVGPLGPATSVLNDGQYGGSESLICRIWRSLQEDHASIYLNWGVPNWYQNVGFPHIQLVTEALNTERTVVPLNIVWVYHTKLIPTTSFSHKCGHITAALAMPGT